MNDTFHKYDFRKIFLILLKYLPVVQMVAAAINNVFYICDWFLPYDVISFFFGNSILMASVYLIASQVFLYCIWQKIIIITNLSLLLIGYADIIFDFDIEFLNYLIIFYTVLMVGVFTALFFHIKNNNNVEREKSCIER